MAEDANVLEVLDPQSHAVPGPLARPHLRDAPCEQALLGDERRAVRKSTTGQLEAHVACIVLHARPGAAGRTDGDDRIVQRHVDGHVSQRHIPGVW